MGVEVWAFAALVAVLAVYLFPFLVRRREMTGQSNIQDRYSAELRVLDTGATAAADSACGRGGHAELFRRRPEVKGMNRPAVRNVRALRTERELGRARKAHAQARERRRAAAAHRGVVACVLLGVSLGAWVVGALTVLPWWPALVPTALMGVSMVAGRRAAVASAQADRRERHRIAELERELTGLTGRRPTVPVVASKRSLRTQQQPESQPRVPAPDFDDAVLSEQDQPSVHVAPRFVQESFQVRTQSRTSPQAESSSASLRSEADEEVGAAAVSPEPAWGAATADADDATRRPGVETPRARPPQTPQESLAAPPEAGGGGDVEAVGQVKDEGSVGRVVTAGDPPTAGADQPASRDEPSRGGARKGRAELPTATPPQGWRPVHVPAPTYTLAARAPRRAYEEPVVEPGVSVPVPARPHRVRTFTAPDFEERDFQPIDLDAVLERRRAAGE
ncbi:hypothetical protein D4740_12205 [Actinomyces sp. 2119]|uniref:hypothetical protein n=1 Tax=Actinomyces sp. 2119 TaxID=2321393 RepID=UPI000E6CA542|nr:hypothetical protein [Actinomyces sp. 2119]RJF40409.1 hypothetical protein D4740_12205 [Actinomyces sp. 2119]